jgi:hypothetical protein
MKVTSKETDKQESVGKTVQKKEDVNIPKVSNNSNNPTSSSRPEKQLALPSNQTLATAS